MINDSATSVLGSMNLEGRVAVITGGGGFLGRQHALALAEVGASTILIDVNEDRARAVAEEVESTFSTKSIGLQVDITREDSVRDALKASLTSFGRIDVLVNNAANNPSVGADGLSLPSRIEDLPLEVWNDDLAVGLTGAFLCARVFGAVMASKGGGSIINIASDLGLIAPDQRLYRREGLAPDQQPVKPVTYSVVKSGLIGLTRYLATYWAEAGVRANALAPGGVESGQDPEFLARLQNLIPMRRMAQAHEYKAAVVFLASDASSYMTGATISVDGGRTCW